MNQIILMSCMGRKFLSGRPVAPDGSDVDLCHNLVMSQVVGNVCCSGVQAGQAAHKALNRYSSWSLRLRKACKQRQEQQSAA